MQTELGWVQKYREWTERRRRGKTKGHWGKTKDNLDSTCNPGGNLPIKHLDMQDYLVVPCQHFWFWFSLFRQATLTSPECERSPQSEAGTLHLWLITQEPHAGKLFWCCDRKAPLASSLKQIQPIKGQNNAANTVTPNSSSLTVEIQKYLSVTSKARQHF